MECNHSVYNVLPEVNKKVTVFTQMPVVLADSSRLPWGYKINNKPVRKQANWLIIYLPYIGMKFAIKSFTNCYRPSAGSWG